MKHLSVRILLVLAAVAILPPGARGQGAPTIGVDRAWIHPAANGQFETWAFATISNPGKADALVEVRSPDAGSVVLRAATLTDAGSKMRSVPAIPVPARTILTLSADTYFIAFIEAKHPFIAGESVAGTLRFASGRLISVTFQVSEAEGDPRERGN